MTFVSRIDEFHEQAIAATGGLSDFGTDDYHAPLRRMLASVDANARLSALGQMVVGGNVVSHLMGRLIANDGFRRHPGFAAAKIERPIFIVGTMRTGTSALQMLLASDPQYQSLELWLANAPQPRPPRDTWDGNPWFRHQVAALEQFYQVAPIRGAHPMSAERPDECFWVMDQTFWSPSLSMVVNAPDYLDWCLTGDVRFAYRYYHRVLGLIAGGDERRWALKSPCNLWGLDALLAEFPDACIVFMHRDIMTAITSTASVAWAIHHPVEPDLTPQQIGARALRDWGGSLAKAERVRRAHDPRRFIDVHANELHRDPLGTVARIHAHFGLPLPEASRAAIAAQAARDPRAGHADRQYTPEEFGLTREAAFATIGDYGERLRAIEREQGR